MLEDEQAQFDILTVGERLRLAREARAMSLDDVAHRTRIPIRHLQNIENQEWDALPAVTYAIGFARNYANVVGLDGAALANELREQLGGPRRRAAAAEYYEPADPARVPPRPLAIATVVIAVLLIGGYLLWRGTLDDGTSAPPVATQPAPGPAGPAPAPAPAPPPATGQVTLTATGEVWLKITDGDGGPVLFQGMLVAGQPVSVPATARQPLIRTGRPQMLRVSVGGRDLGPLEPVERTIDNVSLLPADLAARPAPGAAAPPSAAPAAPTAGPPPAPRPRRPAPAPAPAPPPAPVDAPLSEPPPQTGFVA